MAGGEGEDEEERRYLSLEVVIVIVRERENGCPGVNATCPKSVGLCLSRTQMLLIRTLLPANPLSELQACYLRPRLYN